MGPELLALVLFLPAIAVAVILAFCFLVLAACPITRVLASRELSQCLAPRLAKHKQG